MVEVSYTQPTRHVGLAPLFDERMMKNIHRVQRAHFNSVEEFAAACPLNKRNLSVIDSAGWIAPDDWAGCTVQGALDMARDGWPEGVRKAKEARAAIDASIPHANRLRAHATAGAVPNVPRFLSGNPLNMRAVRVSESAKRPTIALLVPICSAAQTPVNSFTIQGACSTAVVDMLEDRGYRCDVYAYDMSVKTSYANDGAEIMVKIKDAGAHLNLQTFSFAAGHPGMGRRLALMYSAIEPAFRHLGHGLGRPVQIHANSATGVYTMPSVDKYDTNATPAHNFKTIINHLKLQGCPGVDIDIP